MSQIYKGNFHTRLYLLLLKQNQVSSPNVKPVSATIGIYLSSYPHYIYTQHKQYREMQSDMMSLVKALLDFSPLHTTWD